MKILAFGDLYGNIENIAKLAQLKLPSYDFIIFTGDLLSLKKLIELGKKRAMAGISSKERRTESYGDFFLREFKEELKEAKRVNNFLEKVNKTTKIYGAWGNADLTQFLSAIDFESNIKIIHNKIVNVDELFLVGYNGRKFYIFEEEYPNGLDVLGFPSGKVAKGCHAFSDEQIFEELSETLKPIKEEKIILITHSPPFKILDKVYPRNIEWATKSYGEKAKYGNIGSLGLKKVVKKYQPFLHIFGHIHESKGVKKIGKTTFVNTGSLGEEGDYVEIEINEGVGVKFLNL